jgi:hypothetical protein
VVLKGSDPRISPAALGEADQEAAAIARRNALRRIQDLDARVLKLEQALAWAERDLACALAQTTTLDGVRAQYVTQTTTDGWPMGKGG